MSKKKILRTIYLLYPLIFIFLLLNSTLLVLSSLRYPGGIRVFTNESYSMSPAITPSDLIIVRKQFPLSYDKGDIVTFYTKDSEGKEQIITHRIYKLGGNVYITKGDANLVPDKNYLLPRLIIGKVIVVIPYLGIYLRALRNKVLQPIFLYLPALYIITIEIYNIFMDLQELKITKKKKIKSFHHESPKEQKQK